ncbi:hypothetical protein [Lysobacter claricitrinus]|uniref:hypothetical protein n=1 Tax=Lysobacter claricitrinus TaxID=3367728 RepID=UPI0038B360C5
MFQAIPPFDETPSHTRWLHDLRNLVSTASVAASVGRTLLHDDVESARELLVEAERALHKCRELLANGGDHVRDDDSLSNEPPPVDGDRRHGNGGRRTDA